MKVRDLCKNYSGHVVVFDDVLKINAYVGDSALIPFHLLGRNIFSVSTYESFSDNDVTKFVILS